MSKRQRLRGPRTREEVRADFARQGVSIASWAREHGYRVALVYDVIGGRILGNRGKSHRVAVDLGLKDGLLGTDDTQNAF